MMADVVLVVDDEPALGNFVRRALANSGYDVLVTNHAHAFKTAFVERRPVIVIIDIVMPDTDGIELVRWIAQHNTEVHVIIASGSKSEYARAATLIGKSAGIKTIDNLRKPLGLAELREAIDRHRAGSGDDTATGVSNDGSR